MVGGFCASDCEYGNLAGNGRDLCDPALSCERIYDLSRYAGYGLVVPLLLLVFGAVQLEWPSLIGIGVCFLFLIGIVLFKWKEFREEMHKKFHV